MKRAHQNALENAVPFFAIGLLYALSGASALLEAEARGAATVAFPALGAGVGGVPMELGAKLTLEAVATFAALRPLRVREVRVVLFDPSARARWAESLSLI